MVHTQVKLVFTMNYSDHCLGANNEGVYSWMIHLRDGGRQQIESIHSGCVFPFPIREWQIRNDKKIEKIKNKKSQRDIILLNVRIC